MVIFSGENKPMNERYPSKESGYTQDKENHFDTGGIRTHDLRFRSEAPPFELRGATWKGRCQEYHLINVHI